MRHQMARVADGVTGDQVLRVVAEAFSMGPVSRTELLATAVAAHAPTAVLDALLRLPERLYHDVYDLRGQLMATANR
jgi:hypothetical protein